MNQLELGILLTAKDTASGVMRAFAGVLTSSVVGALSEVANKGAQEEASLERVRVAVENSNGTWAAQSEEILKVVQAGKDLGFHNTELNDSMALLIEQTGSASDAMERIHLAEELARGAHIDLYTASKLLGKVTEDNVKVLGRYGINVAKGADETELFALIQKKFGGQAEEYGKTTAGAIDKTKVAIEGWQAAVGNSLGPAQQYIALLPGLTSGFSLASGAISAAGPVLAGFTGTAVAAAAPVLAVAAAGVLVVEAFLQVKETVDVVKEHWDVFVYALVNGKLNDIPIFGFFFHMAQGVLGLIGNISSAWSNLTSMFNGFQMPSLSLPQFSLPSFADGGVVPGPIGAPRLVVAHGGEEFLGVNGQRGKSASDEVHLHFHAPIYGMEDFRTEVRAAMRDAERRGLR